jgi:hypothetical protein
MLARTKRLNHAPVSGQPQSGSAGGARDSTKGSCRVSPIIRFGRSISPGSELKLAGNVVEPQRAPVVNCREYVTNPVFQRPLANSAGYAM